MDDPYCMVYSILTREWYFSEKLNDSVLIEKCKTKILICNYELGVEYFLGR